MMIFVKVQNLVTGLIVLHTLKMFILTTITEYICWESLHILSLLSYVSSDCNMDYLYTYKYCASYLAVVIG